VNLAWARSTFLVFAVDPKIDPAEPRPIRALRRGSACASSGPSNVGCSRGCRHAVPLQPTRRRDPTRFIPTPCRRAVASANKISRADGPPRVISITDPCQNWRDGQAIAFDIAHDRLETLSQFASDPAQRTSRPHIPAQPKHQIPISRALHTAGLFLGDLPTPDGVRDSSRQRNRRFGRPKSRSRRYLPLSVVAARPLTCAPVGQPTEVNGQTRQHAHRRGGASPFRIALRPSARIGLSPPISSAFRDQLLDRCRLEGPRCA
jgi:hypothetical protein